jgi:viroplasmin and RNaseH domain-containing protein
VILPMSGTKQAKAFIEKTSEQSSKVIHEKQCSTLANKSRKYLSLEFVTLRGLKTDSSRDVLSAAEKDKERMQNERKSLNTFLTDKPQ